jgi:hypothetical protein
VGRHPLPGHLLCGAHSLGLAVLSVPDCSDTGQHAATFHDAFLAGFTCPSFFGRTCLVCVLTNLIPTNAYQIFAKAIHLLPNMSTSANSFQTTEGYAIEGTQKGLPSPIELFKPGFTWQHATNPQSPFFNGDGQWLDPTKRAECSFFADAENAEWVSLAAALYSYHRLRRSWIPPHGLSTIQIPAKRTNRR